MSTCISIQYSSVCVSGMRVSSNGLLVGGDGAANERPSDWQKQTDVLVVVLFSLLCASRGC